MIPLELLAAAAGLAAGGLVGLRLGAKARGRTRRYWVLNATVLALGILGEFVGMVLGQQWLSYASIGFMAGGFTGLKYGYAQTLTSLWRETAETPAAQGAENPLAGDDCPALGQPMPGLADTVDPRERGTHSERESPN